MGSGAVMYQAYRAAIVPLAGMEMRKTRCRSFWRALCSLFHFAFRIRIGPILSTLPFVDLLTRLTFPMPRCPILDQAAAATGTRKSSPLVSMAQTERAILLASAIATSIFGLRTSMRCSQLPSGAPFRQAQRTTAIAPMISSRRNRARV